MNYASFIWPVMAVITVIAALLFGWAIAKNANGSVP